MRTARNLSDLTKQRISDSMKTHHQEKGEVEKQQIAQKQSESMKKYWITIPSTPPNDRLPQEKDT